MAQISIDDEREPPDLQSVAEPLVDLFPGFESRYLQCRSSPKSFSETGLFCRIGGNGPPLLLLHGYPQNHVMWHRIAPGLSERYTLILADLPGYGQSGLPPAISGDESRIVSQSKRTMAGLLNDLMRQLGYDRFFMAGHDRGGRVAYRMALDLPEGVERLLLLDIQPTSAYWQAMDRAFALSMYHWAFLAQPFPMPETLISSAPDYYLEHTLASWSATGDLSWLAPHALYHYRHAFRTPARLSAMCDDYRAGASIDVAHDEDDMAQSLRISAPTRILWGGTGLAEKAQSPLETWRNWATDVDGFAVPGGHFLAEESPDDILELFIDFFS